MTEPRPASVFDLEADNALEAQRDAEAEADVSAKRVVPHEKVRLWLLNLAHGRKTAPPDA